MIVDVAADQWGPFDVFVGPRWALYELGVLYDSFIATFSIAECIRRGSNQEARLDERLEKLRPCLDEMDSEAHLRKRQFIKSCATVKDIWSHKGSMLYGTIETQSARQDQDYATCFI